MISERALVRAFGSFWNDLLPLLTSRFIAVFNAQYQQPLNDSLEKPLRALPVAHGIHPDLVAEFAFRFARLVHERNTTPLDHATKEAFVVQAEREAFNLINLYEGMQSTDTESLSAIELTEGIHLSERYLSLYSAFEGERKIRFCPAIPGAGFVASTEADISINETLIEVKTTTRPPSGQDIRQLIVYLALDANAGRSEWSRVGIFNPRRGSFHCIDADELLFQLSGGRLRPDVLADLIAFVQSYDPHIERTF